MTKAGTRYIKRLQQREDNARAARVLRIIRGMKAVGSRFTDAELFQIEDPLHRAFGRTKLR